jgi:hypothetical protein
MEYHWLCAQQMTNNAPRSSRSWYRIKLFLPLLSATVALLLCIILIADCKSSIQIVDTRVGLFSYSETPSSQCISYSKPPDGITYHLELPQDQQLDTAQNTSLIVMTFGALLWLFLAVATFVPRLNLVWPKILSITVALVLGNIQMLSVIKFIRYTIDAFPDYSTDVHYASRSLVVFSVGMWFATAVFIGMCGIVMDPRTGREGSRNPPPRVVDKKRTLSDVLEEDEPAESSEEDEDPEESGIVVDNDLSKCDVVYPQELV